MALERTYYCEGPDCPAPMEGDTPRHARTVTPPPHLPSGFLEVRTREQGVDYINHFCSWDCCMKYAATKPASEYLPIDELPGEQP